MSKLAIILLVIGLVLVVLSILFPVLNVIVPKRWKDIAGFITWAVFVLYIIITAILMAIFN